MMSHVCGSNFTSSFLIFYLSQKRKKKKKKLLSLEFLAKKKSLHKSTTITVQHFCYVPIISHHINICEKICVYQFIEYTDHYM